MVVGRFPGFSLITQIFKQITKPLSKSIVRYAQAHPFFRKYFLVTPGQLYHWGETRMKLHVTGGRKPKAKELDEAAAMELGAQLMIEILIFTIAGLIAVLEAIRSSAKSAALESRKREDLQRIIDRKEQLTLLVEQREQAIRQLRLAVLKYSEEVGYPVSPSNSE